MEKTKLILEPISNGKAILLEEYVYDVNGYLIRVPKSFITDGASVPHSLQWLYNPYGKYINAAVVHDYLYSVYNNTGINRTLSDKIFRHIMKETGIDNRTRRKFYMAVKCFGETSWKSKLQNEGYKDRAIIDRTKEAKEYYAYWYKKLKL
ncbi:DUF1353 domain-containing protein [Fusobacterium vincentii]|uniref:DUF1353 domain-containing protein n=1 Tax=Fusobacterium TaxID=848 RepID=UPI0003B8B334|nr:MULTISPECIES: DUF1353 domain-containing protein [Fusobacterium]ATV05997.1 DUF1353 domain-containing protein [Fusobacterium vincentii]ERT44456.1 hypothetical protein HMPREF1768_01925 [Fusobacterium nucleatum CTI-7]